MGDIVVHQDAGAPVKFKEPTLTDFTRMGLKLYQMTKDPEAAKKFRWVGKPVKDKEGYVLFPMAIKEDLIQDLMAPFLLEGKIIFDERKENECPKVPGKRKTVPQRTLRPSLKNKKTQNKKRK